MVDLYKRIKNKFVRGLIRFSPLLPSLLVTLMIMRGMELSKDYQSQLVITEIIWADFLLFLSLLPLFFGVFLFSQQFVPKHPHRILFYSGSFCLLLYSGLIVYFVTAQVPLGSDIFAYSISDSIQIIADSVTLNSYLVMVFVLPLLLFGLLLHVFKQVRWHPMISLLMIAGGVFIQNLSYANRLKSVNKNNEYVYQVTQNKGAFFMESLLAYYNQDATISSAMTPLTYLDPAYPFLRMENTVDVLSPLLLVDSAVKPNLIFIQVEGLGRAFSGPNAYLGSFTPFLDELAKKSLYFENFLSAQGRTFAALPSILGSLPFAETGFSDLEKDIPNFHSLISIAKNNGYQSTYYGGFEMNFDHQGLFMQKAGIDKIVSLENFDKDLVMAAPLGYSDRDLLEKVLQSTMGTLPIFQFIQTLSMHNPFTVPDQEKYLQQVEIHMNKSGFTEAKKMVNRPYKNIFASILFTDDALSRYFDEVTKLPAFKHTIFVITGDHRLPEIPLSTKIDRYHVPLLIYSPMLKKSRLISSISSHLDIAPSFAVFLRNSYQMKTPDRVTWVGTGLDVHTEFRNIHEYPLKQGKTVLHNYLKGLSYLDKGALYTVGANLDLEPLNDEKKLKKMISDFNKFLLKNESFIRSKKLMPALN